MNTNIDIVKVIVLDVNANIVIVKIIIVDVKVNIVIAIIIILGVNINIVFVIVVIVDVQGPLEVFMMKLSLTEYGEVAGRYGVVACSWCRCPAQVRATVLGFNG